MFKIFTRKAAPETPGANVPETATLETRHGPVNMSRVQLAPGAVAYVCHREDRAEDAMLHVGRVDFVTIDRNRGEAHEPENVMSETSDSGKGDYLYAAERACDNYLLMGKAVVVVFFDHLNDQSGTTRDVLKKIRDKFPAAKPALDCLELPKEPSKPRLAEADPVKPPPPQDFHYGC